MPKKICSWDVGIINLAYCIIEKNDDIDDDTDGNATGNTDIDKINGKINDKHNFKILHWEVIDIAKKEKKPQCQTEDCKRTAVYAYLDNDKLCHICGVHSKKHLKYKPSIGELDDEFIRKPEKNECCHEGCQTGAYYNYCKESYCSVHKKAKIRN